MKHLNKTNIRKQFLDKRNGLSQQKKDKYDITIANQLLELNIWDKQYFHLYLPIEKFNEIDTSYILHILQGRDKEVIISKTDISTLEMEHFLLTENTKIKKNQWDIPEPLSGIPVKEELLEVIFVPLLASDLSGNRIGYGKGCYDRFLSRCQPNTIKIGLSYFDPLEKNSFEVEKTDIKLNYLISPNKIYSFS